MESLSAGAQVEFVRGANLASEERGVPKAEAASQAACRQYGGVRLFHARGGE